MLKIAGLCAATMIMSLAVGAAMAQNVQPKVVTFDRLVYSLPKGKLTATERRNPLCIGRAVETHNDGVVVDAGVKSYQPIFRSAFEAAGLHVEGGSGINLFDDQGSSSAQYVLRGAVRDMDINFCYPQIIVTAPDENPSQAVLKDVVKGDIDIVVNWQLYSRLQNKVVFQKDIASRISQKSAIRGGPDHLIGLAFAENFRLLANDPALKTELMGPAAPRDQLVQPERAASAIPLEGAHDIQPRALGDAADSVVVIYAGNALGSGVLISRDGYILTDAHVVGASTVVRLRWSDGKETTAQVVRVSAARDVALLKTEGVGGRNPLPMQNTPPPVGSTVYAIGSPEGQQFAGTLTRGIVSSVRVMNGLNYIQSDVTTGHGGSGGPLLDEKGYVIGLTDLAFGRDATSSGLTFFTPVKDALHFLGVEVH